MLALKIIICILSLTTLFVARIMYDKADYLATEDSNTVACIAGILGIIFCALLITTNLNFYIIPKILLFISFCLLLLVNGNKKTGIRFWIAIVLTSISFIIGLQIEYYNMEKCEVSENSIPNAYEFNLE